jgi:phosphatidylglycerophosphatase A
MKNPLLWVAQGFMTGRSPVAPGTVGSLLGIPWVALLLWPGTPWTYALGALAGIALSVWLCGVAEQLLGETDPPSVVLDEIVAFPLCFTGWLILSHWGRGLPVGPTSLVSEGNWKWTIGIYIAFRVFDIAKPWPVRQSQNLPGGWGVTVDDLLAAVYVNLVVLLVWVVT